MYLPILIFVACVSVTCAALFIGSAVLGGQMGQAQDAARDQERGGDE